MARGIAAVVDAIFLLLIAVVAAGIVLSAANHYGRNFDVQAHKLLINYYAKQVVRTLVTASVERPGGLPDYLLAYLKENVEMFKELGPAEERLKEVIEKAMYPIRDQYDYAVMLDGRGTTWNTVYLFYKVTVNGREENGTVVYRRDFSKLDDWINSMGTVYTSSTTIFLRFCPANVSCYYIPVSIRVLVFPRGEVGPPS